MSKVSNIQKIRNALKGKDLSVNEIMPETNLSMGKIVRIINQSKFRNEFEISTDKKTFTKIHLKEEV